MLFRDLYNYLSEKGFKVCSIGQMDKSCTEPTLLFYDAGEEEITITKNFNKQKIEIWIFYPINRFSEVEGFKNEVEKTIEEFGKVRQEYDASPISIDDDMKAYFTKLSYFRYIQRRR